MNYCYICSNCKVTSYYRKTFHHLYTRAAEDMGISNITGKRFKHVMQSLVSDHLVQCNCVINLDNFITTTDSDRFKLLLGESLLIKRDKPIIKKAVKLFPLELF